MRYFDGEKMYTEDEILDVAEKHLNEVALHNLMKTGSFGDIALGMSICMAHVIQDLRLNSIRADKIVDGLQTEAVRKVQRVA